MGLNVTDVGLPKKGQLHELKKHAATIHCSNTLSLLQRKISNALLYHAYKELLIKEEHEISVKQLCNLIGYSGNNHSVIKDALKEMLSTVIEWNVVSDTTGQEDWTASSMLASVSLRGPICLYAYSPRMKQLLHSPSMFGKINLFIQSRFKSSYGLALYENCIRYRGLPHTKWFEIDIFRKIMGVPGDKYTIFRDFKKRVLDKSIEEVNTYSDLFVEPELGKEGRQVVKVRFLLKERAKKTRLGANANSEEAGDAHSDLKNKLASQFGLSLEQIEQVFSEYACENILEKVELIEFSNNYQQGKIQNLAAYFMSALKNNYQAGKSSAVNQRERNKQAAQLQLNLKEQSRRVEQSKEEYQVYREQAIDEELSRLDPDTKVLFLEKFQQYAASSIQTILRLQRNKYTRETVLNSPQIKAQMRQFALQEITNLGDGLLSFEKFLEKESDSRAWNQLQILEQDELIEDVEIEM